jgi:GDP-D-mannose 3',5'-epimerase
MRLKNAKVVVCGAGGFIGGHLVKSLLDNGANVIRAVDLKPLDEWYQRSPGVPNLTLDLKDKDSCMKAAHGAQAIFQLAADMGGMGFIENNKALCMLSVLTNTHMLVAAREKGVERFFYASSACVYNGDKQTSADVVALKEEDAYPAFPEDGYGWEKLFSERMCRHFEEDFGLFTAPSVPGPADAKKRRPPSAVKSSRPSHRANIKSKYGVTANRPAASCISTIAPGVHRRSSKVKSMSPSTWAAANW